MCVAIALGFWRFVSSTLAGYADAALRRECDSLSVLCDSQKRTIETLEAQVQFYQMAHATNLKMLDGMSATHGYKSTQR